MGEESVWPSASPASAFVKAEKFSLLLQKSKRRLTLQVTGLPSHRKNPHRTVRNSLVCIGEESDQPTLRCIVSAVLKKTLDDILDKEIRFDDTKEFEIIDPERFIKSLSRSSLEESAQIPFNSTQLPVSSDETIERKIGINNKACREDLAKELATYNLPEWDGPLVLVTSLARKASDLKAVGVWRGLYQPSKDSDGDSLVWEVFTISNSGHRSGKITATGHFSQGRGESPIARFVHYLLGFAPILLVYRYTVGAIVNAHQRLFHR